MKRIITAVLIFAMSISLVGCNEGKDETSSVKKDSQKNVETNVTVEEVGLTVISDKVTYTGELKASQTVSVSAKASATASKVNVEVGDYVKAGDILLVLDDTDYQIQYSQAKTAYDQAVANYNQAVVAQKQAKVAYTQAEASVGQARAAQKQAEAGYNSAVSTYNSVTNGTAQQTTLQLKAALDAAKLEYDNATLNYENQKTLYESGAISKSAYDAAVTRYENAKLNYDTAQENYDLGVDVIISENAQNAQSGVDSAQEAVNSAKAGVKSAEAGVQNAGTNIENTEVGVERAKAGVESAQLQVENAQNALNNTIVYAPISGYIATRNTNRGQVVAQGVELFTIKATETINVEINVAESVISYLHTGAKVPVLVKAVSENKISGTISNISPTKDAQTGMYKVLVQIDGVNKVLKDGMIADVELTLNESVNAVTVSAESVLEDDKGQKYVYIVDGNKAVRADIRTGIITNEKVEVVEGINAGDKVVVSGKEYISEKNNLVKIVD